MSWEPVARAPRPADVVEWPHWDLAGPSFRLSCPLGTPFHSDHNPKDSKRASVDSSVATKVTVLPMRMETFSEYLFI